jgi:ribonuclease HI
MIQFWVDGSSSLKSGRCAWAVVGEAYGFPVRLSGGMVGTNQLSELEALHQALLLVPEGEEATITSDSLYAIMGCTHWRTNWEKNNWVSTSGKPVSHIELWKNVHRAYDKCKAKLIHVKGHTGVEGNELADALAGLQRAVDEGRANPEELRKYLAG